MPGGVRLVSLFVALLTASAAFGADLATVAERVRRGVLLVEASSPRVERSGSGFFLDRRGLVATALHTIEGARRIRVSMPGLFSASDATLLAASSAWDIAILEVPWSDGLPYPGLALDGGGLLPAGTEVAVSGYGLSRFGPVVPLTIRGIVSGTVPNRDGSLYVLDVAATPGLSGGPVFRSDTGAVGGILTRILTENGESGPGGAVPAAVIHSLLQGIGKSR